MILDVMDDEEEGQTDGFGEEDDDMEFGESQNGTPRRPCLGKATVVRIGRTGTFFCPSEAKLRLVFVGSC